MKRLLLNLDRRTSLQQGLVELRNFVLKINIKKEVLIMSTGGYGKDDGGLVSIFCLFLAHIQRHRYVGILHFGLRKTKHFLGLF